MAVTLEYVMELNPSELRDRIKALEYQREGLLGHVRCLCSMAESLRNGDPCNNQVQRSLDHHRERAAYHAAQAQRIQDQVDNLPTLLEGYEKRLAELRAECHLLRNAEKLAKLKELQSKINGMIEDGVEEIDEDMIV